MWGKHRVYLSRVQLQREAVKLNDTRELFKTMRKLLDRIRPGILKPLRKPKSYRQANQSLGTIEAYIHVLRNLSLQVSAKDWVKNQILDESKALSSYIRHHSNEKLGKKGQDLVVKMRTAVRKANWTEAKGYLSEIEEILTKWE